MDNAYQAIFDSMMLHSGQWSHAVDVWKQEVCFAAAQHAAPAAVYRPELSVDGNQWCALYGANLQDGVAGFGESPALAMEDFNKEWAAKLTNRDAHE